MALRRVSPADARKLLETEGYVYIDVRSETEYAAGHPVGAHNVPIMDMGPRGMTPNPDFLDVLQAAYPKDAKLVVGCRSGQRSLKAVEAMIAAGYTDVVEQRAGFDGPRTSFGALIESGWAPCGYPVETVTPGASYAEIKQKAGK